jgi:hypothetical protein
MDKGKRKTSEFNSRRYWRIFLPLGIILLLCVRFPIRITLPDLYDDILLYGAISLISLLVAIRIYHRSKWAYRQLLVVILLCAVLSGWQVIDLGVLRFQTSGAYCFCDLYNGYKSSFMGFAWYEPRFRNPEIMCHSIREHFIGNEYLAITTETRHVPWYACGG